MNLTMNKSMIFVSAVVILLLAGCQAAVENKMEKDIEDKTGGDADVDLGSREAKVTVDTDEGEQTTEMKVKNEDSWCQAGSEWSTSGPQGVGKMVIVGIVEGGKYDGFCHVTYDVDAPDAQANVDFYFNEDGDGYQVMEVNGQKYESQWTG